MFLAFIPIDLVTTVTHVLIDNFCFTYLWTIFVLVGYIIANYDVGYYNIGKSYFNGGGLIGFKILAST